MFDALVSRVESSTPATRERAIDGFRALAMLGVVVGHWLVGALFLQSDGSLRITSPLRELGFFAPASWFLQMLGLFFLVGGYSAALSLSRSTARGSSYGAWLRGRYVRLFRPVVAAAGVSVVLLGGLALLGVPSGTLRTWVVLFLQPLWFIGIYAVVTALTRYAEWADRRFGAWAALPLLAIVLVVDVLRYGPWQSGVPSWVGLLNLLPGWLFAYQLGVSWGRGSLRKAGAWVLMVGGVALFAVLLWRFGYPASMVGVPGEGRTNAHPPSLLVLALASAQSGAAILLRSRVEAWLQRPALWAGVVVLNLSAMTVFCWHQAPNVLVSLAGSAFGSVQGLTNAPTDLSWLFARLAWLPVLALVLVAIVAAMARFERSWKGLPRAAGFTAGVLSLGFAGLALALY